MHRVSIFGAVVLVLAGMGVTRVAGLEQRVARLDELGREAPERARVLRQELGSLREDLGDLRAALGEARESDTAETRRMRTQCDRLQEQLDAQDAQLERLEAGYADWSSHRVESRLAELESSVWSQWDGLVQTVTATASLAERTSAELVELNEGLRRPREETLWHSMVGPVVQLAGDSTVGSGVLLASRPAGEPDAWETLLVTSWHVVRDIRADSLEEDPPIPVAIYAPDGQVRHETAQLVLHDVALDAALLRLNSERRVPCGARLPARAELDALRVFRAVYAVGCPLGNDPIPTRGELADLEHEVDGSSYWMISAPTYIGNSGGGIFDAETRTLLGIFSKIYTHGALRPTVVPHMGLVTPMTQIYDWLEGSGLVELVPAGDGVAIVVTPPAPRPQ